MDDLAREPRTLDLFAARLVAKAKAPRIAIIVDQFEELFTLCQDPSERKAFIDNLLCAATQDGVVSVILTLRADFYGYCAEFDNLREHLRLASATLALCHARSCVPLSKNPRSKADGTWSQD